MKKIYIKPEAEYIEFYSEEDIADIGVGFEEGSGYNSTEDGDPWMD
jgi:hypothetical protein